MHEQLTRIEDELLTQRETIRDGFAAVDVRFGQVDARFEQVEKQFEPVDKRFDQFDKRLDKRALYTHQRFDDMKTHTGRWIGVLTLMVGFLTVAITVTNFL